MIIVPSNVAKKTGVELVSYAYIGSGDSTTAFPTHQAGDLLMILCGGYGGSTPAAPSFGGNVPNYNNNYYRTYMYYSAISWAIATSSSHTTGGWGSYTYAAVFRGAASVVSKYNTGIGYNGSGNSSVPNYFSFTPNISTGSSMFVHLCSGYSNSGFASGTFPSSQAFMLDYNDGSPGAGIIRGAIVKSKTDPTINGFGTCTSAYYYNISGVEVLAAA